MTVLRLKSSDDEVFEVESEVAFCSALIKEMVTNLGTKEEDEETIPLMNVASSELKKVIEWAMYHKDDPVVEDEDEIEKDSRDISPWDVEFMKKIEIPQLFQLILAANYLDIKPLLDLSCKTVANMMKGKTPEEIRMKFTIKKDFVEGEEEKICREREWCEDK